MRLREYFAMPGAKTQAEVAEEVGKSRGYISRVTSGDLIPALKPAIAICKATDDRVTVEELIPAPKTPAPASDPLFHCGTSVYEEVG